MKTETERMRETAVRNKYFVQPVLTKLVWIVMMQTQTSSNLLEFLE